MFKNYLKIATRNLFRNKNYSLLNIGGLALGMMVIIFITLWINDEMSYNKCHENYDSIAKVYRKNNSGMVSQIVTTGFGTQLKFKYGSHFKHIALLRQRLEQRVLSFKNNKFTEGGYFVQPDGPKMFTLKMIYGSRDGLEDLRTILLSKSLADKLFGNKNPLNQMLNMGGEWELKVTGVYEDLPIKSEFSDAAFFAPLDVYLQGWSNLNVWDNYNMRLYVQIHTGSSFDEVTDIIKNSMLSRVSQEDVESKLEVFLHPMSEWHLNSKFENGESIISEKQLAIWFFSISGIFVLLLACINFMNLNTACSEKRIKEIGVKKTLGSLRINLVAQFFGEALIVSFISLCISFIFVQLTLPSFNEFVSKELILPWTNKLFWILSIFFIIITSILAGGYPAFYLSSFNPVNALKGRIQSRQSSFLSRKMLVVFQFSISIALIIGSMIVYKQVHYAKNRPVGFSKEGLVAIKPDIPKEKIDILRTELKRTGVVEEITEASNAITNTYGWIGGIDWVGKNENNNASFNYVLTNHEYCKTMGLEFLEGRDFSRDITDDYAGVIINESAKKIMSFDNPIGEIVISNQINNRIERFRILGLVKDMVKGSPYDEAIPTAIFLTKNDLRFVYLRLNPQNSAHYALPKIKAAFENVVPSIPFDYEFVDEVHAAKFKEEEKIGKLSGLSAILAIIISCLGLHGLSSFMVERRTKEIGIRKVVGASITSILGLLTSSFAKSVFVANIFAWPIAYYFMNSWLQNFTYRTDITIWPFLFAGGIALLISLFTVSLKSIRAAIANPVNSLRNE